MQSADCIQSVSQYLPVLDEGVEKSFILFVYQVRNNESDATIIGIKNQQQARESQLIPVAHELTDDHYFVVAKKELSDEELYKLPMYALYLELLEFP